MVKVVESWQQQQKKEPAIWDIGLWGSECAPTFSKVPKSILFVLVTKHTVQRDASLSIVSPMYKIHHLYRYGSTNDSRFCCGHFGCFSSLPKFVKPGFPIFLFLSGKGFFGCAVGNVDSRVVVAGPVVAGPVVAGLAGVAGCNQRTNHETKQSGTPNQIALCLRAADDKRSRATSTPAGPVFDRRPLLAFFEELLTPRSFHPKASRAFPSPSENRPTQKDFLPTLSLGAVHRPYPSWTTTTTTTSSRRSSSFGAGGPTAQPRVSTIRFLSANTKTGRSPRHPRPFRFRQAWRHHR